jgi:leucine dehydrogenase
MRTKGIFMVQSAASLGLAEDLHLIDDPQSGAVGVIALHSTALGPAAGGCRFWSYASQDAMITDAMRLARGMSYKNALAGLPFGGGKAVLQRPAAPFDRRRLFEAFGDAVAQLGGRYVTAEDVGTNVADMEIVAARTSHVAGREVQPGKAGGDPSPWTALGIFKSMQAASRLALGKELKGLTIAVQGVGNVGAGLCDLLAAAGARLIVSDADERRAALVAAKHGAVLVEPDEILSIDADILAPCALGAILNATSIPALKVGLICGGANNQLAVDADGDRLRARGIAYAPDYVVNAGGIINVASEYLGETLADVSRRIDGIADRVSQIMCRASAEGRSSHVVADDLAQSLITGRARSMAA